MSHRIECSDCGMIDVPRDVPLDVAADAHLDKHYNAGDSKGIVVVPENVPWTHKRFGKSD